MNERDTRVKITVKFPQFNFDFVFLKAVDEACVVPIIENWDYATGQGPIYFDISKPQFLPLISLKSNTKNLTRISYVVFVIFITFLNYQDKYFFVT